MEPKADGAVLDLPHMRDRRGVFADRTAAGKVLAEMLEVYRGSPAVVLAVPAGGVPVAATIARRLRLPLDVAVVSKITPPFDSEIGYGAVAFDGTVRLNLPFVQRLGLDKATVEEGVAATTQKVQRRVRELRGGRAFPDLSARISILVDDGLASGLTLSVAVEALRKAGAERIVLAVPTAHAGGAEVLAREVEKVFCPNVRAGWAFAVADAYRRWTDVPEAEVARILKRLAAEPQQN